MKFIKKIPYVQILNIPIGEAFVLNDKDDTPYIRTRVHKNQMITIVNLSDGDILEINDGLFVWPKNYKLVEE